MRSLRPSGFLSFAAIAQLAPAFFGGLFWRRGTARGAHRRHDRRHPGVGLYAAAAELRRHRHRQAHASSADGPWGLVMLRPQHLFGLDLPPLVHGVLWSLALNVLRLCRLLVAVARRRRSSACRPICSCRPISHRSRRASGCGARRSRLRNSPPRSRAISARSARARRSKASPPTHRISLEPKERGRLPAAALRRASARLGDRRRLVAARAVAAAAQAHGVDQGGAASCSTTPTPRSSTTARSCRPRSIMCARASRCSTRTCNWSAGTGSSAKSSICRRSLTRVGTALARNPALQRRARRRRARRVEQFVRDAARALCLRQRAVLRALRRRAAW